MFGFVTANLGKLTKEQRARYQGVYCGLCRALKERHGELSRLTLNYDMAFLVLVLSSMYEPEESAGRGRCAVHPLRTRDWYRNRFSDYAADMNVALAYYHCMDDWADDRKVLSLGGAKLLESRFRAVEALWPRQCAAMGACMDAIAAIESGAQSGPDDAEKAFGVLMGELFAPEPDSLWNGRFRAFGEALGRFVYMMDACVDMEQDRKRGHYNPLLKLHPEGLTPQARLELLKMLMGECTAEFERLPLVQDAEILRSVLYSGVWTQYAAKLIGKKKGDAKDEQRSV